MKIKNIISIIAALCFFGALSSCEQNELPVLPDPPIKTDVLYIVGNGTLIDWDNNNPIPLQVSPDNPNIFIYDGFLKKGEVKLCFEKGSWGVEFIRPVVAGSPIGTDPIVDEKFIVHAGDPDNKWNVVEDGLYTLTFDLYNRTMSSEYKGMSDGTFKLKSGPSLQNMGENEVTIMWRTNKPAKSWVEIAPDDDTDFDATERPKFNAERNGAAVVDTLHKVTVRNLAPDTKYRYRIFSQEVVARLPWKIYYGGTVSIDETPAFRTMNKNGETVNFLIMNDIHENNSVLRSLASMVDKDKTDFVVFNGDMVNWITNEDQLFNGFIDTSSETFAKNVPFVMVKGNHEPRGIWSQYYMNYFPTRTKKAYYAFRDGPVYFIVLDSGEDQADSYDEYSDAVFFNAYRTREAEWLKKVLASDECKNAPYRIVLVHMPPIYANDAGGHADFSEKFFPMLNAAKIDVMFSGHFHKFDYTPAGWRKSTFPILINSNVDAVDVKVNMQKIQVDVRNTSGAVIHSYSYARK